MSANYEKVKNYYDKQLWTQSQVKMAVVKIWITAEEFKTITGQDYTA
ncbi:hypothetical protein SDC9_145879 [bioreactor metagenome]|uniref:XkdX family protein n=1 Tax=bioreactor metagenome TaxID=1076179 RepID=A0A645EBI9_9ZZZZ|nr:XkdX family protein [Candidatus Metalachnospira sp.]